MDEVIRKFALQNAIKFHGSANPKAVIGHVFSEEPGLKKKSKEVMQRINEIVEEISQLSVEEMTKELKKLAPELLEKKEKQEKDLPELKNAEMGKVVTRIAPEPSKYNHIGHALSFLINYVYAKKYQGKCILRFEDTNPGKASQEYVDAMMSDVIEYLDIKPDKIIHVSDEMLKFYELAEDLINRGEAYVCFCEREKMQKLRMEGKPCECRDRKIEENMKFWKEMLENVYDSGAATLRLRIDMELNNMVMRDPVIFRVVEDHHYRQKDQYSVWPMFDFENAVEEHFCGVTHVFRSAEFGQMRVELQDYIKDLFGFTHQTVRQYGRFNVVGAITQGREIRAMIEEGKAIGWDDPRLVTLRALRRRGVLKETYYEMVKQVGLSKNPTNIDWTMIAAISRKLLDKKAHRYFFLQNPVEIEVEGAPELAVELNLHPDNMKGGRRFKTTDKFLIDYDDAESFEDGKVQRMMDCLNFVKEKDVFRFVSTDLKDFKKNGQQIIHWLPNDKRVVDVEIFMPDATWLKGKAESGVKDLKVNDVIQFERFGFCRVDEIKGKKIKFWYTHK